MFESYRKCLNLIVNVWPGTETLLLQQRVHAIKERDSLLRKKGKYFHKINTIPGSSSSRRGCEVNRCWSDYGHARASANARGTRAQHSLCLRGSFLISLESILSKYLSIYLSTDLSISTYTRKHLHCCSGYFTRYIWFMLLTNWAAERYYDQR